MYDKTPVEKIHIVSWCYQESFNDTLLSVNASENKIQVNGPQKATPHFSTNGGWARSYETPDYRLNFDTTKCAYTLLFKSQIPPNSAFIYTANGNWKKVN